MCFIPLHAQGFESVRPELLITTDQIFTRYYCVQRLKPIFVYLEQAYNDESIKYFHPKSKDFTFSDQYVSACLIGNNKGRNVLSLFKLWKNFRQYKYTGCSKFLREFLLLVFVVCKNVAYEKGVMVEQELVEQLEHSDITFPETINSLSVEDVLSAIDVASEDFLLVPVCDNYDDSFTFTCLLKKHWYVVPIMITAITFKILDVIKAKYTYDSLKDYIDMRLAS